MNLRLNYLWVAILGVMCGAIVSGHFSTVSVLAEQSGQDTLTARKIIIVGKDGKVRATIGVEDDGAADIVLYDGSGTRRVGLGTDGKGPDGKGPDGKGPKRRGGGGAALNLFDENGKTIRNRLYVRDADGSTGLTLNDRFGQPHAGLAINAVGSPASP
jgi:hypothetical protein